MGKCASKPTPIAYRSNQSQMEPSMSRHFKAFGDDGREESVLSIAPPPVTRAATVANPPVDIDFKDKGFAQFKAAVGRVLSVKRMWSRFWSELDEADERDLHFRYELQCNVRDALSNKDKDVHIPAPKVNTGIRIKARGPSKTEPRRKSYVAKTEAEGFAPDDIYDGYARVPSAFLWELTQVQHTARAEIASHPRAGERRSVKSDIYEVATLPPLSDEAPLSQDWIDAMLAQVKHERIVSFADAFYIVTRAVRTFMSVPNVAEVTVSAGINVHVVGDLHGQLDDLLMVFKEAGKPSAENRFLFNGDFVDRGKFSCEILLILLAYRALYPSYVHLNRGNHESSDMCQFGGFMAEASAKYGSSLYALFTHTFACMPIATVVSVGQQRVFVVHAGLSFEDVTLQDINNEDRFCLSFDMNSILQDLLWSDPYNGHGRMLSKRGAGCQFGADVCARFLVRNKLQLLIRSHECEDNGYNLWFDNRCYTIFSASDYCGDSGNYGAFCTLSGAPAPQIRVFMAKRQVLSYSDRQRRSRQQVLSKLLVRISSKIFQLEAALKARADAEGRCSAIAWGVTLQEVLGVDAPFLCIANKLGVENVNKRMNVQTWCDKFKPPAATDSVSGATPGVLLRRKIAALLFDTTSPFVSGLEMLFEHFDSDKDGSISTEEFKDGLQTLMSVLQITSVTDDEVNTLVADIDINNDGEVDFEEFFKAFAYGSIDLAVEDLEV